MRKKKLSQDCEWYDNPAYVTNLMIFLIFVIVVLSQSFAINNNLSAIDILGSILNHNSIYLIVCIYFLALKMKIGRVYFDFLNLFMIVLYGIISIASFLTIFQSFGLASLLKLTGDLLVFVYLIHTFLRSTHIWKSAKLNKSPFNEITNSGYFYSILVIEVILLAVNLIVTTSIDGTILTLLDFCYYVLLSRYVYLYGEYLNAKKINANNDGNFDKYRAEIATGIDKIVKENNLEDEYNSVRNSVNEVKDKINEIKEDVSKKLEETTIDDKIIEFKNDVVDFVKEDLFDKKDTDNTAVVNEKVEVVNEKVETTKPKKRFYKHHNREEYSNGEYPSRNRNANNRKKVFNKNNKKDSQEVSK